MGFAVLNQIVIALLFLLILWNLLFFVKMLSANKIVSANLDNVLEHILMVSKERAVAGLIVQPVITHLQTGVKDTTVKQMKIVH